MSPTTSPTTSEPRFCMDRTLRIYHEPHPGCPGVEEPPTRQLVEALRARIVDLECEVDDLTVRLAADGPRWDTVGVVDSRVVEQQVRIEPVAS